MQGRRSGYGRGRGREIERKWGFCSFVCRLELFGVPHSSHHIILHTTIWRRFSYASAEVVEVEALFPKIRMLFSTSVNVIIVIRW